MQITVIGQQGAPGRSCFFGLGPPSTALGLDNDSYVDVGNGYALYTRASGTWSRSGQLMQTINGKTGAVVTLAPADVGAAAADANGVLLLSAFPVRTAQVISAARVELVRLGTKLSLYVETCIGDVDTSDRSWEMFYVEPTAPIGGLLWVSLGNFLQGALGLTQTAATAELIVIWAAANKLSP